MGLTTTSLLSDSGPTRLAFVRTGSPFGPSASSHAEGFPPIQRKAAFFHGGGECPVCTSVRGMNVRPADSTTRKYSHAAFCRNTKCSALKGPGYISDRLGLGFRQRWSHPTKYRWTLWHSYKHHNELNESGGDGDIILVNCLLSDRNVEEDRPQSFVLLRGYNCLPRCGEVGLRSVAAMDGVEGLSAGIGCQRADHGFSGDGGIGVRGGIKGQGRTMGSVK